VDTHQKVRENRVRRGARRQGLELQRFRARDHRHVLYDTYQIVRPDGSVVAAKEHPVFGKSYGLTLDEAEHILLGLITPAEAAELLRTTPINLSRWQENRR
jgi:hypothetical protein